MVRSNIKKYQIKGSMRGKRPTTKWIVIAMVLCAIVIIFCKENSKNTPKENPYEWAHSISIEDIDSYSATNLGEKTIQYYVSEKEIEDLVYALNSLAWGDFIQGDLISDGEFTLMLKCGKKECSLTYGSGETMFLCENNKEENKHVWKTNNQLLAKCMKRIMNESLQVVSTTQDILLQPTKEQVLKMRNMLFEGMSEEEIQDVTKLVHTGNKIAESDYLPANEFLDYLDPNSLHWNLFAERGNVIVGYGFDSQTPKYNPNSGITEQEYNEKYGTPVVISNNEPLSEQFYLYIERIENLLKTDYLDADFDEMRRCMQLAIDTHDVKYIHDIYYKLHDLDYYLFQYGPEDVSPLIAYGSSIEIYYGCLKVYGGVLPTVTEVYSLKDTSYYKMSDGSWRKGLYSYKYKLELSGRLEGEKKDTHYVVLSNRKNISFLEVWKAKEGKEFSINEIVTVFSWQ